MKDKHIRARIEACLALAACSNCPRGKHGAMLLDPERNVVLADGYNGAPRGGGELCGGSYCLRNGLDRTSMHILPEGGDLTIQVDGRVLERYPKTTRNRDLWARMDALATPPIPSGTNTEVGCHHAEMNVICNAAANGTATKGGWLIVTGEPCRMCAKLIHHAGIVKVLVVNGGYGGPNGVGYLRKHGVEVTSYSVSDRGIT